jgi:glutamine synthetase
LIKPEAIELFEKYGVFNDRELHSRYEVRLEQYALTVGVEAKLALEVGTTVILPSAVRYQTELAQNVLALKAAGLPPSMTALEEVSGLLAELESGLAELKAALADHSAESALDEAKHAQEKLLPAMTVIRTAADALEAVVADDLWPLPTYQEMLYIL